MRVLLFTDTLGDVNGVARFITMAAERARATGRSLTVFTSTRIPAPRADNIINFSPRLAARLPGYDHLEIVWPRTGEMERIARRLRPDLIHLSTPGPVGLAGRRIARRLGVPTLGVYHTDFPAYVDQLWDDVVCSYLARRFMAWFYSPMAAVVARSGAYEGRLGELGVAPERRCTLLAGIDLGLFDASKRDPGVWEHVRGARAGAVKVLYCGRVSVEKGLMALARAWPGVSLRAREAGVRAQLVIIGDGPMRESLSGLLPGEDVLFLGYKRGEELATLYASCDLFVFPSKTDTLGQVVLEAQASGLPTIVAAGGGPAGLVIDGRTGVVVREDHPGAWAEAICGLVLDRERRQRMGCDAWRAAQTRGFADSFESFWSIHERVRRAIVAGPCEGR